MSLFKYILPFQHWVANFSFVQGPDKLGCTMFTPISYHKQSEFMYSFLHGCKNRRGRISSLLVFWWACLCHIFSHQSRVGITDHLKTMKLQMGNKQPNQINHINCKENNRGSLVLLLWKLIAWGCPTQNRFCSMQIEPGINDFAYLWVFSTGEALINSCVQNSPLVCAMLPQPRVWQRFESSLLEQWNESKTQTWNLFNSKTFTKLKSVHYWLPLLSGLRTLIISYCSTFSFY